MRQIISQRTYRAMYRLLDRVSPIDGDCGRLCGSICCTIDNAPEIPKSSDNILLQDIEDVNKHNHYKMSDDVTANRDIATAEEDEQVLGIYLYPGEESLFASGTPVRMLFAWTCPMRPAPMMPTLTMCFLRLQN